LILFLDLLLFQLSKVIILHREEKILPRDSWKIMAGKRDKVRTRSYSPLVLVKSPTFCPGLGKAEQGMHVPLHVQKTGTKAGIIIDKSGTFVKSKRND
jgi:hypothetical protein